MVFGPLLNASHAHPDTVLTTLIYLENTLEWPLPLYIFGAASRNDAYADVVSCVHRDDDEGIRCGCPAHCSLRRSSVASAQASYVLMHCETIVLLRQCCSIIFSEWYKDVLGADRVHWGSQRTPGWEAMGGLPDQAHSSSLAVSVCTERRRLPTPACQRRGDDALLLCDRAHELRQIHDLVSEERWKPVNGGQCRPNEGCTCMSSLRRRDAAVLADQFGEKTCIRRGKGAGGFGAYPRMPSKSQFGSRSDVLPWRCEEKPFGGTDGECKTENKHKEEDERRRKMDENNSHPLNVKSTGEYICNIVDGQVAPTNANGQEALHIGSQREKFIALLPGAFHINIERKVNNMQRWRRLSTWTVWPYLTLKPDSPDPIRNLQLHVIRAHLQIML